MVRLFLSLSSPCILELTIKHRLDTINSLPPGLVYKSASQTAIELVPELRKQGAEIIVAVTHQREPNDNKLAEKIPPGLIDIILGGHDHYYSHSLINGVHVLRSGTDFKQLSYIEAYRKSDSTGWDFSITRRDVVRSIPIDTQADELVTKLTSSLKEKLEKPIGYTASPLDGRFTTVRTRESNLGNFVCDLMRFYYNADCTMMAAGTIRGDQVYPPGLLRLKDILNCFPFEDPVIVLRLSGKSLVDALENGVSQLPALEGRFPQVSNINFEFTASAPPGSRVYWVKVGGQPVDYERKYTLATRGYMGRGKDGYTSLLVQSEGGEVEELVSEENGMLISAILRQYFMSLKIMGKWRRMSVSLHRHWDDIHSRLLAECGGGWIKTPSPMVEKKETSLWNTTTTTTKSTHHHHDIKPKRPKAHRYGRYHDRNMHKRIHAHAAQDQNNNGKTASSSAPSSSYPSSEDSSTTNIPHVMDSESDSEPEILISSYEETNYVTYTATSSTDEENRMRLARKVLKKWMRLAGVHSSGCVEDAGEEFTPSWTWGIAPRCEGRILTRTKTAGSGGRENIPNGTV
jgi:hypothetical protein